MNENPLLQLATTFALVSLIAIGGANATIPEIHRQVVSTLHWMSDPTFATLIAIAQTAPGPNVMIVSMIGWQVAGGLGFIVATVAMVVPSSLLAFAVGRGVRRYRDLRAVVVARRALAPIAIGLMLASGLVLSRAADVGWLYGAITAGTAALVLFTRATPLWGMAAGVIAALGAYMLIT